MGKKDFNALEIEVISFDQADIIRTSESVGGADGGGTLNPDAGGFV